MFAGITAVDAGAALPFLLDHGFVADRALHPHHHIVAHIVLQDNRRGCRRWVMSRIWLAAVLTALLTGAGCSWVNDNLLCPLSSECSAMQQAAEFMDQENQFMHECEQGNQFACDYAGAAAKTAEPAMRTLR